MLTMVFVAPMASFLWISNYPLYDDVVLSVFGPEYNLFICDLYILTLVCVFCI